MIYWVEFHQKPIVAVTCILALYSTMAYDFTETFVTDTQQGRFDETGEHFAKS